MPNPLPDPLSIGPQLARTVDVVRKAGLSLLLRGPHGIGKSGFLVSYARERGLEPFTLDLSLMEPADLTGIPYLREQDGERTTAFAPPETLPPPTASRTVLVIEELNRCDRSLRQPCLQLISARRLNSYVLPEDCFVAACVNPDEGTHEVDPLDPALQSRFVLVDVRPDREAWLDWADSQGLHRGVHTFLQEQPAAFERATPRAWEQASRLCQEALSAGWKVSELADLLGWILPPQAAKALVLSLHGAGVPKVISAKALIADPLSHAETFATWRERGRIDLLQATLEGLQTHLGSRAAPSAEARAALTMLLQDYVPPDLAIPLLEALNR